MATGHFSGRAGVVMERDYNRNFSNGKSRHFQDGDLAIGIGGPEGIDALTITTRPSTERPPSTSGIHHYLGRNAVGGTNLYAVAFTGEIWGRGTGLGGGERRRERKDETGKASRAALGLRVPQYVSYLQCSTLC